MNPIPRPRQPLDEPGRLDIAAALVELTGLTPDEVAERIEQVTA